MELLCTVSNYNSNQQSSIPLPLDSAIFFHQTCIPFMCVLFDDTQYATFSLLFSTHTHVQDANTSDLLLINVLNDNGPGSHLHFTINHQCCDGFT